MVVASKYHQDRVFTQIFVQSEPEMPKSMVSQDTPCSHHPMPLSLFSKKSVMISSEMLDAPSSSFLKS